MAIPGLKFRGNMDKMFLGVDIADRQELVIQAVIQHYGLSFDDLTIRARGREYRIPRQVTMYLLNKLLGMGCVDVSKLFKLHHTTSLHAFKKVQDLIDTDDNFRNEVRGIKENI
jgi:chromosomal replication initiation ATPase DnaA